MSCLLTLFNAKHCVVNTLLDFKLTFSSGLHFPDPIDLSCWKAWLNKLVTAAGVGSRGKRAPNPVCYNGE